MKRNNVKQIHDWLVLRPGYKKWSSKKIAAYLEVSVKDVEEAKVLLVSSNFSKPEKWIFSDYSWKNVETEVLPKEEFFENLKGRFEYGNTHSATFPHKAFNPANILVIPDLHIPCELKGSLEFCKEVREKYNCGSVIFLGDIWDSALITRHPANPQLRMSKIEELELTQKALIPWHNSFKFATVLGGNHCQRYVKMAALAGIPTQYLRDLKDILDTPTWNYVSEYELQGILFQHGEGGTATDIAIYKNQSTCQGHLHSQCYINYVKQGVFACQAGSLVDRKAMQFDYAKHSVKEWVTGVTVIINGLPQFIPYNK